MSEFIVQILVNQYNIRRTRLEKNYESYFHIVHDIFGNNLNNNNNNNIDNYSIIFLFNLFSKYWDPIFISNSMKLLTSQVGIKWLMYNSIDSWYSLMTLNADSQSKM